MKKLFTFLFCLLLFSSSFATVAPIHGNNTVCVRASVTLSDSSAFGVWSSSNVSVVTIGNSTGIMTGVAAGTAVINYSTGSGHVTYAVTVLPSPAIISGVSAIYVGNSLTLSDTTAGGTWASGNNSIASFSGGSGLVYGNSAGSTNLSYTISDGCSSVETLNVYNPVSPITGLFGVCNSYSTNFSDLTPGGKWSSSDTVVAAIDSASGLLTGISPGTAIITYQVAIGIYATHEVTIGAIPPHITGPIGVLVSDSVSLSDSLAGGTWTSSNIAITLADSATGMVHGISAGSATITYTLTDGCYSMAAVTVYSSLTPINGTSLICMGNSVLFADTLIGGRWSSNDTVIAKVDSATGLVTGMVVGSAIITYTLDTFYATQAVTVNPMADPIVGQNWFCVNSSPIYTILIDSIPGGIRTSSSPDTGRVDSTGMVTAGPGFSLFPYWEDSVIITYTVSLGCSASYKVYIWRCEGISTITNNNTIAIFPNPATTQLTIQSTNDPIKQIVITNLIGQTLETHEIFKGEKMVSIDVSGFPAGIYFVKVNNTEVRRFVKE